MMACGHQEPYRCPRCSLCCQCRHRYVERLGGWYVKCKGTWHKAVPAASVVNSLPGASL